MELIKFLVSIANGNYYFQSRLRQRIKRMIASCTTCQITKGDKVLNKSFGHFKIRGLCPWKIVGIDHVIGDDLDAEPRYILTIVDYLTKFIVATVVPDLSANTTIGLLKRVFRNESTPQCIISD